MSAARPSVVFIGPSSAGKSKIGRRVAALLEQPLVDTDQVIVAAHGPIPELFQTHGEAHFRTLERAAVAAALQQPGVLSLGGGAVVAPETQALLAGHRIVLLTVTPEAVASRISGDSKRPLVASLDDWVHLYEARREIYERLAGITIDTSQRKNADIADEVAAWVRQGAGTT